MGTFGLLAFYLVVIALLPGLAVGWTYLMASAAAIAVNMIALRFVRQAGSPLVS
jgi:inner membrane protein involved in colicin E2 resistance